MAWLTLNGGCDIIYIITLRARLLDKSEFEKENKIEKPYKIDGLSCKGDC